MSSRGGAGRGEEGGRGRSVAPGRRKVLGTLDLNDSLLGGNASRVTGGVRGMEVTAYTLTTCRNLLF